MGQGDQGRRHQARLMKARGDTSPALNPDNTPPRRRSDAPWRESRAARAPRAHCPLASNRDRPADRSSAPRAQIAHSSPLWHCTATLSPQRFEHVRSVHTVAAAQLHQFIVQIPHFQFLVRSCFGQVVLCPAFRLILHLKHAPLLRLMYWKRLSVALSLSVA